MACLPCSRNSIALFCLWFMLLFPDNVSSIRCMYICVVVNWRIRGSLRPSIMNWIKEHVEIIAQNKEYIYRRFYITHQCYKGLWIWIYVTRVISVICRINKITHGCLETQYLGDAISRRLNISETQYLIPEGSRYRIERRKERLYFRVIMCYLFNRGRGGGLLPYLCYTGMCRGIGYGFWGAQSLNRELFLVFWSLDRVVFVTLQYLNAWLY